MLILINLGWQRFDIGSLIKSIAANKKLYNQLFIKILNILQSVQIFTANTSITLRSELDTVYLFIIFPPNRTFCQVIGEKENKKCIPS
jgi:hypothetical protein